jgi:hypothetical protein
MALGYADSYEIVRNWFTAAGYATHDCSRIYNVAFIVEGHRGTAIAAVARRPLAATSIPVLCTRMAYAVAAGIKCYTYTHGMVYYSTQRTLRSAGIGIFYVDDSGASIRLDAGQPAAAGYQAIPAKQLTTPNGWYGSLKMPCNPCSPVRQYAI